MAEKGISLRFELCSSKNNTVITTEIPFDSMPRSFHHIRRVIEDIYSIPQCVQRISVCYPDYCHEVKAVETPASLYIRNGDLLRINFPMQGECREVRCARNMLFSMLSSLAKLYNAAMNKQQEDQEMAMSFVSKYMLRKSITADNLAASLSLFHTLTDIAHINKLFFISEGGLDLLMQFYEIVIGFRKKNLTLQDRDIFEMVCIHAISSFTGSVDFNRYFANQACLEVFQDTFLWQPVKCDMSDIQIGAIQLALQAICNIIVPDHYSELDRSYEVIVQTIRIGMSPSFTCKTVATSMMLLSCMTYCCKLCVNLVPKILFDVLHIVQYRREMHADETTDLTILEAYAATLISLQIINDVGAYQKYEKRLLTEITELLRKFCDSDPSIVRNYEADTEFFWGRSLPALALLYRPDNGENSRSHSSSLFQDITQLCTQSLLHSLHIVLGRKKNVASLRRQNLFDYVICLPWIVPSHSHPKALALVKEVGKLVQLQPLSLHSMAKAKLAKMKYGLQRIRKTITVTDLLYP